MNSTHFNSSANDCEDSRSKITAFPISIWTISSVLVVINTGLLSSIVLRRLRPVGCMIVQLALISIWTSLFLSLWIMGLDKIFNHVWMCSLFLYLKNVTINLISLGVAGLSYERGRSFFENYFVGACIAKTLLFFIWFISISAAIPIILASDLVPVTNPCGQVEMICIESSSSLEDFYLGIHYEYYRAGIFHVLVPLYLLYELKKVRQKCQILNKTSDYCKTNRSKRKILRLRYICINSVTFILFWVPFGTLWSIYKNTSLDDSFQEFEENGGVEAENNERSPYFYILSVLFAAYIPLLPLITFYINEITTNQPNSPVKGRRKKPKPTAIQVETPVKSGCLKARSGKEFRLIPSAKSIRFQLQKEEEEPLNYPSNQEEESESPKPCCSKTLVQVYITKPDEEPPIPKISKEDEVEEKEEDDSEEELTLTNQAIKDEEEEDDEFDDEELIRIFSNEEEENYDEEEDYDDEEELVPKFSEEVLI